MIAFIGRRIAMLIPIWVILAVVSFSLLHLAPGSPAAILLGPEATPTGVQRLNSELGLSDPLVVQFFRWLGGVLHGDFGESYFLNSAVLPQLFSHFSITLQLSVLGAVVAVVIGITAGTISATRRGGIGDALTTFGSTLGFATPEFVLGLLLVVVFAVTVPVFPVQGYTSFVQSPGDWLLHLILPALTIGLIQAGPLTRITRTAVLRTLGQDYIRTARAKGISQTQVVVVHALRNALLPILTGLGLILTSLLAGTFVTEVVFQVPGFGELMLNSALNRDFPTLQGGVIFIGSVVLLVNLAVDVAYRLVDPRVRSLS